jgi:hypothetical protein
MKNLVHIMVNINKIIIIARKHTIDQKREKKNLIKSKILNITGK